MSKKVCSKCLTEVGNACKRCSNCGEIFPKRQNIQSLPRHTSTTSQKSLLMKRALTLQQNHGYHVVVMYYHPSSTGGPNVWDFSATPGLATEFIASNSRMGKAARDLFKHGMESMLPKYQESHNSQSEITNRPSDQSFTQTTVQNPNHGFSVSAVTGSQAPPAITNQPPVLPVPTHLSSGPLQALVSPPSVAPAQTNKHRVTTGHLQVATTNPLKSVAQTNQILASQQQLPSLKGKNSDPTTTLTAGTVVSLNDEAGIVCAQGCVTGFSTHHNRQVPSGHTSVVVTSIVAGKSCTSVSKYF